MKKIALTFCIIIGLLKVQAQEFSIIPQPEKLTVETGNFNIIPSTKIVLKAEGFEKSAAFLNDYFQQFFGFKLDIVKTGSNTNNIVLKYEKI